MIKRNKKGCIPWNKGLTKDMDSRLDYERPTVYKTGQKAKNWNGWKKGDHGNRATEFKKGQTVGAKNTNWKGGISLVKKEPRRLKTKKELLERKRFTNMRYKARKRDAIGSHTFEEWLLLKEYYQNMCLCCKRQEPEVKLTEDHIIPLSKGGSDKMTNIQPLCVSCNTRKHARNINYIDNFERSVRNL